MMINEVTVGLQQKLAMCINALKTRHHLIMVHL